MQTTRRVSMRVDVIWWCDQCWPNSPCFYPMFRTQKPASETLASKICKDGIDI